MTLAACGGGDIAPHDEIVDLAGLDADDDATLGPVDLGWGPGVDRPASDRRQRLALGSSTVPVAAVNGGPQAHLQGVFGPVFNWPIIPIHMVLLPDGRVMSYGTNQLGQQGGRYYTIWDPTVGEGTDSMLTLTQKSGTIIFCNTQLLLPSSGELLLLGGTRKDERGKVHDTSDVDIFDPLSNSLTLNTSSMAYARWYGTAVTMASGDQVVMGGRKTTTRKATADQPAVAATYASTPEVYHSGLGWRTLVDATDESAYGAAEGSWWYPFAWQAPNGSVFVLSSRAGRMFSLDTTGTGTLQVYANRVPGASAKMPSAMFAPGKILSVRDANRAVVIDINGPEPIVTLSQPPSVQRVDQTATVLADGKVWVNGGSATHLRLPTAYYHSETWDPATGTWTTGASAAKARLYHSSAILLADGRVLSGGGGAPGPVTNLNAEVYYPPYLFKSDGSGELAVRPTIDQVPDRKLVWGEIVPIAVSASTQIDRVTLVRTGAVTHTFNNEQRFMSLDFVQTAQGIEVSMPLNRNHAPPGYYLMFVFDAHGVPSVATVLQLSDV